MPRSKHVFDLVVLGLASVVVIPALLVCVSAIWLLDGRPILYRSTRRVHRQTSMAIVKFRTMKRHADKIANRNTVPITTTRFLNISIDSPLYTPVGRLIERCMLTEMPQLGYVLRGKMSLVGNRPLPENVISALKETGEDVEARFLSPAGITGPAQLVGREYISDTDRLRLESAYCRVATRNYSAWLDFKILFLTVVVGLLPDRRLAPADVMALLQHHAERRPWFDAERVLLPFKRLARLG